MPEKKRLAEKIDEEHFAKELTLLAAVKTSWADHLVAPLSWQA